tara:strand:- start:367 stop:564 length:198 start_codon:yes stop_codon:yes gene_type:complete
MSIAQMISMIASIAMTLKTTGRISILVKLRLLALRFALGQNSVYRQETSNGRAVFVFSFTTLSPS